MPTERPERQPARSRLGKPLLAAAAAALLFAGIVAANGLSTPPQNCPPHNPHCQTASTTTVTTSVSTTATTTTAVTTTTVASTTTAPTTTAATTTTAAANRWAGFVGVDQSHTADFPTLARMGVSRVRLDTPSATTIETAASDGIKVLPVAAYEPWPDLNGGMSNKYPPLPQYDVTWADRMLAQWTSLPSPPEAIEVWNEPWLTSFWEPKPDPNAYLQLVKAFAAEAWKIWPNVKILVSADTVGSTNTTGSTLWRQPLLADDTGGLLADPRVQPTTHNYVQARSPTAVTSQPCSWDLNRYQCAYNDFKAHGNPNPQVWVTEFGWHSDYPATDGVTEQQQADYTTQAYGIFRSSGEVAVAYCFMYASSVTTWTAYDWLRSDNSAKPVVAAVTSMIAAG